LVGGGVEWIHPAEDRDRWRGLLWMRWWTFGFWRHGVSLLGCAKNALKACKFRSRIRGHK
jgi:hypothetical protein